MTETNTDHWLLAVRGESRAPAGMPRAGVLVIGSDARQAGYVVAGVGIEGAHCAIGRTKGGGFAVKDLGTRGGTFLNGRRVDSGRLSVGDEIGIGTTTLYVVDPDAPAESPSAKPNVRAPGPDETQEFEAAMPTGSAATSVSTSAAPSPSANVAGAPPSLEETASRSGPLPSIPGYRIEKRIGRGGMGDVYLAVQESLARSVAVKVLAARFEADREFVRRFQAEARAAAALNHPNVVTVYDVGEAGGTHYLSMEFMDRGNLEDRLRNDARLSESEVLDILRDATSGLVYAEARGIVHRDLKPANLMQNHVGATKIADLGLATHVESEEAKTGDKKVFGTPHFISPEQARGERVDSRSDLFSLGATAYRLLTGRTPFEGKDAREIVRSLLRDEPKPMREFAPDVSEGMAALVGRLMKKDVAERFASANDVLAEIERLRSPSPRAVSLAGEPRAPRRSRGGLVLFLLLVLGGGGWWWWQQQQQGAPSTSGTGPVTQRNGTGNGNAGNSNTDSSPTDPSMPPTDPRGATTTKPPLQGATVTTTPEKDDKDLQLLEANAKLAMLELKSKELSPTERRDELRLLAAKFQGTTTATDALQAAETITNEMVGAEAARAARKIEIDAVLEKMRAAAKVDEVPPHPGKSFLAMRAVEGQAALKDDPQFIEGRKSIETIVSRTAVMYANQMLGEASILLDKGEYEAGLKKFQEMMPVFDLPDFPMGEAPANVSELFDKGRTARERMHTIEQSRDVFEHRREKDDALAVAQGLGGPSGLESELRTLDLEAARARLERVAANVSGSKCQTFLKEQAADCARGHAVIETLAKECAAGNWRRKSFIDPRDRKGVTRNAVGADAVGLLYEGAGGASDRVPWSAFGGNTRELSRLFSERCTREWTPDELRSIAALLRLTACVEAIDITAKMFDGSKKANFTEANKKELLDAFAVATEGASHAPDEREEAAREAAAANVLGGMLRLMTDSRWSSAVAENERLITDFKDSLLVRLLSNGLEPDAVK